jgi:O-antigen ligase
VIHQLRLAVVPAYLFLCLVLGGASAAGIWANLALQLLGLLLIVYALSVERRTPMATPGRQLLAIAFLALTLIALQLVPLPPSIWETLPGREPIAQGYRLVGQPLPWLSVSMSPLDTRAGLIWTIPALAILLGIVKLGGYKPGTVGWLIVAVTVVSVAIGTLQVGGGSWYFYQITNRGVGTGFFANANHQATLLVATIPFLSALYLVGKNRGQSAQRASGLLVSLAGALMVVMVGLAINGSLAGIGLGVPVICASLLMLWSRKRRPPAWAAALALVVVAAAVYLPFKAPIGSNNLTSAEAATSQSSRRTTISTTIRAGQDHLPFGTGLGTFIEVYRTYEDPLLIDRFYVNRAHSDFAEFFLEAGLVAVLIVLLFLLWWLRRLIAVWRAEKPDHLARAASIASAAILAHSLVDYPLRTAAIGALFAVCCALMSEPRPRADRRNVEDSPNQARHLSAD